MITEVFGDILKEPKTTWVVIPVNCYGVAGAGLAKQWKEQCPEAYEIYRAACKDSLISPGSARWIETKEGQFILAATKDRWQSPSRIEWVECILEDLSLRLKLASGALNVAIPPIGAGLGGLDPDQVHDLIYYWLSSRYGDERLDRHRIYVYSPR
jgi:O-acetyl-ADP-ribose deacetylase (regulator of RNase III)